MNAPFPAPSHLPAPPDIDVEGLIERSQPVARAPLSLYAAAGFSAALLAGAAFQWQTDAGPLAGMLWSLSLLGMLILLSILAARSATAQRREIEQTETVDELIETDRFGEATLLLLNLLDRPLRLSHARVRALATLSRLLSRYGRYEQSMQVEDHLLSEPMLDPSLAYTLRLSRAMSQLRLDRLYDVDRAISDLRRQTLRSDARGDDDDVMPIRIGHRDHASAGLALVELYRDVKTGHSADALDLFERRKPLFRDQLGHRYGDALAMAACAADMLGQTDLAQSLLADATVLQPAAELSRRIPETQKLLAKYASSPAPAEAL